MLTLVNLSQKCLFMLVILRSREHNQRKSYFLDYTIAGKRYRKTVKMRKGLSKREALEYAEKARAKKQLEIDRAHGMVKVVMSTNELFDEYLDQYQNKDHRKVSSSVAAFQRKIDNTLLENINPNTAKTFKDYVSNNYSPDTANSYYGSISKIFNYAVNKNYIYHNPFRKVTNVRTPSNLHKDTLTKEEINLLIDIPCPNNEVKRAFILATQTGLGNTDCKNLDYSQIQDGFIRGVRGKSRDHPIPINALAAEMIGTGEGSIFNLPSGTMINKALKKWCKTANIDKHITFYCARHSFATNLLNNGVDLDMTRRLMGHTSFKHILRYLHRTDDELTKAIKKL